MEASNPADMAPIVSLVTYAIGCGTLLIALGMLRGFITKGISIAVAEFFLRSNDQEQIQKMCRWFGSGDEILEYYEDIKEKMAKDKKKT
jgi:hypothetical protein